MSSLKFGLLFRLDKSLIFQVTLKIVNRTGTRAEPNNPVRFLPSCYSTHPHRSIWIQSIVSLLIHLVLLKISAKFSFLLLLGTSPDLHNLLMVIGSSVTMTSYVSLSTWVSIQPGPTGVCWLRIALSLQRKKKSKFEFMVQAYTYEGIQHSS